MAQEAHSETDLCPRKFTGGALSNTTFKGVKEEKLGGGRPWVIREAQKLDLPTKVPVSGCGLPSLGRSCDLRLPSDELSS